MIDSISYKGISYEVNYEILGPAIYVYHNAIPKEWNCIERIEQSLKIPNTRFKWNKSKTNNPKKYKDVDQEIRNCSDFKINEKSLSPIDNYSFDLFDLYNQIMNSLKVCIEHYKPKNYLYKIEWFECINVVKYGKNEFFKTHADDGDPYRCTLSSVGYPNDNYKGGELTFPLFNLSYKPVAGDFILCPSSYAYSHSSDPVLDDGIKYSFVIMADRNAFAHRNDSPIYHSKELGLKYEVY